MTTIGIARIVFKLLRGYKIKTWKVFTDQAFKGIPVILNILNSEGFCFSV